MNQRQSGFTMIEVLVTIGILMVGLLGLAGLQTQATIAEFEAYQRSQALVLVQDLADRMATNKPNAANYVSTGLGTSDMGACGGYTDYKLDLCEWNNQLFGAAEVTGGGRNVGAMIGAQGCVTLVAANVYLVTVAWQGLSATAAPNEQCGKGSYGDDRQRRAVSMILRVATLSAV